MMKTIRIPKEHVEVLAKLLAIDEQQKSEIISHLNDIVIGHTPRALAEEFIPNTEFNDDDALNLFSMLFHLIATKKKLEVDKDQFSQIILNSIDKESAPSFSKEDFVSKLFSFVDSCEDTILKTLSVLDAAGDHQRWLLESSIQVDLRPVFDAQSSLPTVATILYQLKLTIKSSEQTEEIFVTLDSDDIEDLREALSIAQKEAQAIRTITTIPIVDLK